MSVVVDILFCLVQQPQGMWLCFALVVILLCIASLCSGYMLSVQWSWGAVCGCAGLRLDSIVTFEVLYDDFGITSCHG